MQESRTSSTRMNDAEHTAASAVEAIREFLTSVKQVKRRNGETVDFDIGKLERSVRAAFGTAGTPSDKDAALVSRVCEDVLARITGAFDGHTVPSTADIRSLVAATLIDHNHMHVARRYIGHAFDTRGDAAAPVYGKGICVERLYTRPGVHPYSEIEWSLRDASITNDKGAVVFEQKNVEFPAFYSQTATNITVSKYFRGRLGTPERETSMRQVVDRVSKTIADWGRVGGYFQAETDADVFEAELTSILINQRAAFNSPVWFNVGVNPHPQCSACFINSVQDDMRSILNLAVTEGMLFKYGSGTGSNLSHLRSSKEKLTNSSGQSSGPVSFMKGLDAFAGVIKSGGKTRRAAKMVILDVEHPDIKEFVWCKAREEKKAHALIDAGYPGDMNGEAYSSIFFQNANNSVRVTDAFMQAAVEEGDFWTTYVTSKDPCEKHNARELLREIAQAAWECGDPGMQYDTTINDWHTCPETDRIYASNPCSEYMFLNDSACNLASVNLMACRDGQGHFDVKAFEHVCRIVITAQEILVGSSSYPTPSIERNSHRYRPLGLGYANLGALLMSVGIPYDSDRGRNIAAAVTSVMSGAAYEQSSRIAERVGTFAGYAKNSGPMLRVMRMHRDAARRIDGGGVWQDLHERALSAWDDAIARGERHGYRNAQISVLAPTGTISFLMDCDTTGVEPAISLVSYKWLVGGGMLKIVNRVVPEALHRMGYDEARIREILAYIDAHDTIEGAPHLSEDDLAVFDCAFKPAKGKRSIPYKGHIRMMSAVQPFVSGAISKTVNLPADATVEDVMSVYLDSWKAGLKAVAIYRDGCKRAQPLTTTRQETSGAKSADAPQSAAAVPVAAKSAADAPRARRRRMPDERRSITHKFEIGPHQGFITVGLHDDGTPGEIFITMSKDGSTLAGLMGVFATSVSIGLQYGVPLKTLVNKFAHVRFEPSGFTQNPNIRIAKSIIDYIFRWLGMKFLPPEDCRALGLNAIPADVLAADAVDARAEQLAIASFTAPSGVSAPVTDLQRLTATIDNHSDAPACDTCGSIMVRNAACYKCLNCGATSGCS